MNITRINTCVKRLASTHVRHMHRRLTLLMFGISVLSSELSLSLSLFCHFSLKRTLALLLCLRSALHCCCCCRRVLLAATSVCTSRSWSRRTSVRAADVAVKGKQNGHRCCCLLCVMPEQRQSKDGPCGASFIQFFIFGFQFTSNARTVRTC